MTWARRWAWALCAIAVFAGGCWGVGDLKPYHASDGGDIDTDTDPDVAAAPSTAAALAGRGAVRTTSAKGWISVGHLPSSEPLETPSFRISLGVEPVTAQQMGDQTP